MPKTIDRATRGAIVAKICAAHAADGLRPDEMDVRDNGEVWIDRSARDPRNIPFVVGHWKKQ